MLQVTFQGRAEEKSPSEGNNFWREWMQILYKDWHSTGYMTKDPNMLQHCHEPAIGFDWGIGIGIW